MNIKTFLVTAALVLSSCSYRSTDVWQCSNHNPPHVVEGSTSIMYDLKKCTKENGCSGWYVKSPLLLPVATSARIPDIKDAQDKAEEVIAKKRLQSLADLQNKVAEEINEMSSHGYRRALIVTQFFDKDIVDQEIALLKAKGYKVYVPRESIKWYEVLLLEW